jgi:hypothetical protein
LHPKPKAAQGKMTKAFAVVLGLCFIALGSGRLFLSPGHERGYGLVTGVLFIVVGIACLFNRQKID